MAISNSSIYEEYGFKAHDKGIFKEWREKTCSILEKNPSLDGSDAAVRAYYELVGSK